MYPPDSPVTLNSVSVRYPNGTLAVRSVDFSIQPGQFCSIIGPSGCGKSTILRLVGGLLSPTEGSVSIGSQQVHKPSLTAGFVFQSHNLLPWRTALRNIELALEAGRIPREDRRNRARYWLKAVGLERFENHFPSQLSGGMNQRIGLARALALEPQILLMDEPFGALDAQTRLLMQAQLIELWETRRPTVIFVTHDIEEALFLSDRILVMSSGPGRIIQDITVPFDRPRNDDLRQEARFNHLKSRVWELLRPMIDPTD